jgi:hypothetical protein
MIAAIRSHMATGLAYMGQCPLCGISASSTPPAASFGRYDRAEFSAPNMNMRGQGSVRNFTILITHELDGLDQVDHIVVLDHGKIAEQGTHQQLRRAGGTYQRMWEGGYEPVR